MYPPHGNNSSTTIRHQNTLTESTLHRIYGIFEAIICTIKSVSGQNFFAMTDGKE
jgi:hypothetical protein